MPNALLTGVSGLLAHQRMLDVVGHNIANMNTVGFKSQRVLFADLLYQTVRPATTAGQDDSGGTNPAQIGSGVKLAQVDRQFGQGNLELTGGLFDFALDGDGFFVLNDGSRDIYSRAGAFALDRNGVLVDTGTGSRVMRVGNVGEGSGSDPGFQDPASREITIPLGASIPGEQTTSVAVSGNLSNFAGDHETLITSRPFTDMGGAPATLSTTLNSLSSIGTSYVAGDMIEIDGTDVDNSNVNVIFAVTPTTTMDDLVNEISAAFAGATARLEPNGNISLRADFPGEAMLELEIRDDTSNTGINNWASHSMDKLLEGDDAGTAKHLMEVFDAQGGSHSLALEFRRAAPNVWDLVASMSPADGTVIDSSVQGITFNSDGTFQQITGMGTGDPSITLDFFGIGTPQTIALSFDSPDTFEGLTQFGGGSDLRGRQDGFAPGALTSINVDGNGTIQGVSSNGRIFPVAQLAISAFRNTKGLTAIGNNLFEQSTNSGEAEISTGLTGDRGAVIGGQLESSNVDVALEFTRLIVAQRGFSANARTITVSDEVLEELTNIIR